MCIIDACLLNMHELNNKADTRCSYTKQPGRSFFIVLLLLLALTPMFFHFLICVSSYHRPYTRLNPNKLYKYFITLPAMSSPFLYLSCLLRFSSEALPVTDQHCELFKPRGLWEVEVHYSAYMLMIDSYTRARRPNFSDFPVQCAIPQKYSAGLRDDLRKSRSLCITGS